MFRKMRRFKQELSEKDTVAIFESGSYGVLALAGDDGYPYAVPLSYVYADGKLYVHSASQGHKVDAVKEGDKASFCVVVRDDPAPEKQTTLFESAIAFGRAKIIENDSEKRLALELMAKKYFASNGVEINEEEITKSWSQVCVIGLEIEHMTGKASMDIINSRK